MDKSIKYQILSIKRRDADLHLRNTNLDQAFIDFLKEFLDSDTDFVA
jgi:hypothetical protein